jgi:2-polyprenyl-3-methyl-5-hydroxy-6-metoxy-1,4-benzoquinol methylase
MLNGHKDKILELPTGNDRELELRFGKFRGRSFISDIPFGMFDNVSQWIKKEPSFQPKFHKYVDFRWDNGLRMRRHVAGWGSRDYVDKPSKEDPTQEEITSGKFVKHTVTETWERKEDRRYVEIPEYNLRVSSASERVTSKRNDAPPDLVRKIFRISVLYGMNQIELSTVENIPRNDEPYRTYELEIEMVKNTYKESLNEMLSIAEKIFKVLYDTPIYYSVNEIRNVNTHINLSLSQEKLAIPKYESPRMGNGILRYYFNDARNLHRQDIIDGGLVGKEGSRYRVTDKADGRRRLLCFDATGIWFVGTNSHMLIMRENMSALQGWVLEGEYIPMENRLKSNTGEVAFEAHRKKHVFYVYDVISTNDHGYTIQDFGHDKRMDSIDTILLYMEKIKDVYIEPKMFRVINYTGMYNSISAILNTSYPYKTDGLMFIPMDKPYDTWRKHKLRSIRNLGRTDGLLLPDLKYRNLTDHDDICKWKPSDQLTMDIAIRIKDDIVMLYGGDAKRNVKFNGSGMYHLEWKEGLDPKHELLNPNGIPLPDDTVVECRYIQEGRVGNYLLEPIGIRVDKRKPNQLDVIIDNWDLARRPLTEGTIRGTGTKLMQAYHNDVKYDLIRKIPRGSTILDIGSGKGGDIKKWKSQGLDVYAIEPDQANAEEFKKRMKTHNMEENITLFETYAEDHETIIPYIQRHGKVDAVTFMLSLTFFWKSENHLRNLAYLIQETLRPGGKVYFLTMDGDAVEGYFNPPYGNKRDAYVTDSVTLRLKEDNEVYIHIADTIVTDQTEYLAHMYDLAFLLTSSIDKLRTDKRRTLNDQERLLCNMYCYGALGFSGMSNITKPEPVGIKEKSRVDEKMLSSGIGQSKSTIQDQRGNIRTSIAQDTIQRITIPNQMMFRMGTQKSPSSLIHAFLQAVSPSYNKRSFTDKNRKGIVAAIRMDLAGYLFELANAPEELQLSNWLMIADGYYPIKYVEELSMLEQVIMERERDPDIETNEAFDPSTQEMSKDTRDFTVRSDYSERGAFANLNSLVSPLPESTSIYLADVFNIDIYVAIVKQRGIEMVSTTAYEGSTRHACILGLVSESTTKRSNATHYETIGAEYVDGDKKFFSTLFPYDHPLLQGVKKRLPIMGNQYQEFSERTFPRIIEILDELKSKGSTFTSFRYFRKTFRNDMNFLMKYAMNAIDVEWSDVIEDMPRPLYFSSQNVVREQLGMETTTSKPPIRPMIPGGLTSQIDFSLMTPSTRPSLRIPSAFSSSSGSSGIAGALRPPDLTPGGGIGALAGGVPPLLQFPSIIKR